MAYNGAGTFSLYSPGNPVVTGTTISSTWANNTLTDIATGLSTAITKDGQTTTTQRIPFAAGISNGSQTITALAAGTATTHAATVGQLQSSAVTTLGTIGGTATAITAVASPVVAAYAAGQSFEFTPAETNTGATTINIDSLGAKNIFFNGIALVGGELRISVPVRIKYDGTQFHIIGNGFGPSVGLVRGYIGGLKLSNAADADHDITVAAGSCVDTTGVFPMILATAITKQIDATWAAGTNAGGLFSGSVANNTLYYVFLIRKTSDGSIDAGFDTSVTAANIPSGYAAYRRIGAVRTDSSANIRPFTQNGEMFMLTTPVQDTNGTVNASRSLVGTIVPPSMLGLFRVSGFNTGSSVSIVFQPVAETDAAPSQSASPGITLRSEVANQGAGAHIELAVDASSQIAVRATEATTTYQVVTRGWIDYRGRFD